MIDSAETARQAYDLAVLADETRQGRNARALDDRSGIYAPDSNPWLPARTDWERGLAQAWADGYVAGPITEEALS